jgi:hypothetical protein
MSVPTGAFGLARLARHGDDGGRGTQRCTVGVAPAAADRLGGCIGDAAPGASLACEWSLRMDVITMWLLVWVGPPAITDDNQCCKPRASARQSRRARPIQWTIVIYDVVPAVAAGTALVRHGAFRRVVPASAAGHAGARTGHAAA